MTNKITSVNVEVDDSVTTSLTKSKKVMIRNVSNVRARMYYSEPLGSTYEAVIRNGSNETYSTEDGTLTIEENDRYNFVEVVFPKAASNVFYFEIKNSGASVSYKVSSSERIGLVDYVFPTCKLAVEKNDSGVMTVNITGNYFSGYFDSDDNVAGDNSMYVQYRYKEAGAETWGEWIDVHKYNTADSQWTDTQVYARYNKYTAKIMIRSGLDLNTVYAVEACITDRVGTITSKIEYGYSKPIFDWSAHDFNFNVPVYTNGAMQINGDLNVIGKITQNGISSGGGVDSLINIKYYAMLMRNSIIEISASSRFGCYIIQPFNLVLLDGFISGFKNPLPNSTSYVKLCDFEMDFWPEDDCVLPVSGNSRNALLDINGNLKMKFPEGASTKAEIYISGIYRLSAASSYYKR